MPVYFVQAIDGGPVKIGWSKNPAQRAISVRSGVRKNLRLLATMAGEFEAEQAIHARFTDSRIEGEWFRPAAELLDFISKNGAKPEDEGRVGIDRDEDYWAKKSRGHWRNRFGSARNPAGPAILDYLESNGFIAGRRRNLDIARAASEATGKTVTRFRIASILNSAKVNRDAVDLIAGSFGIDPRELIDTIDA